MLVEQFVKIEQADPVVPKIERPIHFLRLEPELDQCPDCQHKLEFYYSTHPRNITLLTQDLVVKQVVYKCPNPACKIDATHWKTFKSNELLRIVFPRHAYGIDVLLKIGELRFQQKLTLQKVQEQLYTTYGILIEESEVQLYQFKYLALLKETQTENSEVIKEKLECSGGPLWSIDGTSSDKSRTLYICREERHQISLDAQILNKSEVQSLETFISQLIERYGKPAAVVCDDEWGLVSTFHKLQPDTKIQYCQRHFLTNLGDDLMGAQTKTLQQQIDYTIKKKNFGP